MRFRALTRVLTLAAFALLSATAASLAHPDATTTVATWNINGGAPITREKAERIAQAIADLDADVVALSKVNPDSILNIIVAASYSRGLEYNAVILDQTASQNLAILHKPNVTVTDARLIPGSDDGNRFLRKALAANVSVGEFDFILITVHLKAGRRTNDRAIRDRQVAAIAAFIADATTGPEQDVVMLGDFNMRPDQDTENFVTLNANDQLRFVSSEDLAEEISHISECTPLHGSLLDGYAIDADDTTEYIDGSLRIAAIDRALRLDCDQYRGTVSDHLPVVARFRITADDD